LGVNLDDRQIGFLVDANHGRIISHGRGIVHQLDADAIGLLHHVGIGDDVAFGIDNDSRTQRALAQIIAARGARNLSLATLSPLPAKEAIQEVLHGIIVAAVFIGRAWSLLAALAVWVLDGGFGIDVDHGRFKLARDLRELARQLLWRRDL